MQVATGSINTTITDGFEAQMSWNAGPGSSTITCVEDSPERLGS